MTHAPETVSQPETVYLDHAATTPMLPVAREVMTAHLGDVGNPSSLHASGRKARRVVEESRETIAQAINCRPGEVVFTSGGTEADNLALKGLFWSRHDADAQRVRVLGSPTRSTPSSSFSRSTREAASTSMPSARPSSATRHPWP
jgi:cysteine desulfurase